MENYKKGSIEGLAKYFIEENHQGCHFDFEKCVKRIEFSNCFLLRIFNSDNQLNRLYLICPVDRLVAETSQPFYDKMIKYYEEEETIPYKNYWIGYTEVDENFEPQRSQSFQIPDSLLNG